MPLSSTPRLFRILTEASAGGISHVRLKMGVATTEFTGSKVVFNTDQVSFTGGILHFL
jgi:hypothetical protein